MARRLISLCCREHNYRTSISSMPCTYSRHFLLSGKHTPPTTEKVTVKKRKKNKTEEERKLDVWRGEETQDAVESQLVQPGRCTMGVMSLNGRGQGTVIVLCRHYAATLLLIPPAINQLLERKRGPSWPAETPPPFLCFFAVWNGPVSPL